MMTDESRRLIEKYQCPGCTLGPDVFCGSFKAAEIGQGCDGHSFGTAMTGVGFFALGLPKGFNREGARGSLHLRVFTGGYPEYDKFNVAVWAMRHEGDVLVRTYLPRVNRAYVDIVGGAANGKLPLGAIDVGEFYEEID